MVSTSVNRIKLGVLANELFSPEIGRMGGFGWAVQQVAACFSRDPSLGVDVVLLMGEHRQANKTYPATVHGVPVIWGERPSYKCLRRLQSENLDLLLAIDYRRNYRVPFFALARTPILIWVRDPWDQSDRERIRTLRVPGAESETALGSTPAPATSLSQVLWLSRLIGRSTQFAVTSEHLKDKIQGCYRVKPGTIHLLPNLVELAPAAIRKSERPLVVFLARLDPMKRPWIFADLAGRFPDVDFLFLGQRHFQGPGAWNETSLPSNVRCLGHLGEIEKSRILASAWVLVNSSIHEGLSVSFLEALACETPILSCLDPDRVVSRFGIYVGSWPGTGKDGLPAFEAGLRRLLTDQELRTRLGRAGRAWVNSRHCRATFLASLRRIVGNMHPRLAHWAEHTRCLPGWSEIAASRSEAEEHSIRKE